VDNFYSLFFGPWANFSPQDLLNTYPASTERTVPILAQSTEKGFPKKADNHPSPDEKFIEDKGNLCNYFFLIGVNKELFNS